jgi:uncharacterized protein YunC (DUF1805 family)
VPLRGEKYLTIRFSRGNNPAPFFSTQTGREEEARQMSAAWRTPESLIHLLKGAIMNNIKKIGLGITIAVALFAVACGGSSSNDPNSPSGVTRRFVEAARQKDAKTFKSLLSKKSIASVEKDAKEVGISADQMLTKTLEQNLFPAGSSALETRNEQITGDTATVEFKGGDGKWLQNELVREDSNWKVTLE